MSSHCWHVKEPYHSARVQVMGLGRPTQIQERKQYMCAFGVACLPSLTQVRHADALSSLYKSEIGRDINPHI